MPKRIGNLFQRVAAFDNLTLAAKKAMKGCGRTSETCRFFYHREREVLALQKELKAGTYQPGEYRYFTVHDPKERHIAVAPFRDRVVHHAIVNILDPVYERIFIHDSYATRKNKGTHKAILRAQHFLRRWDWYHKADVHQYFANIDHAVLLGIIERKIKDRKLVGLLERIIRNVETDKGLPIGNLTSQFLANVYFDPFDHFIKDHIGIKGYIRYMDDFLLFGSDSKILGKQMAEAEVYLQDVLKLELRGKCTYRNRATHGLSFLGMRIHRGMIRIHPKNKQRSLSRLRHRIQEWRCGRIAEDRLSASLVSIEGHLHHFCPSMPL